MSDSTVRTGQTICLPSTFHPTHKLHIHGHKGFREHRSLLTKWCNPLVMSFKLFNASLHKYSMQEKSKPGATRCCFAYVHKSNFLLMSTSGKQDPCISTLIYFIKSSCLSLCGLGIFMRKQMGWNHLCCSSKENVQCSLFISLLISILCKTL